MSLSHRLTPVYTSFGGTTPASVMTKFLDKHSYLLTNLKRQCYQIWTKQVLREVVVQVLNCHS